MSVIDLLNSPWAIMPDKLREMCAIYGAHVNGERIDLEAIEAKTGRALKNQPTSYTVTDGVAVLPVDGIISKRASLFMDICGGTSTQLFQQELSAALSDPTVNSIILAVDSPGGSVDGIQGAADAVYQARDQKPIVCYVDGNMCSAAYWIGSSASKVFIGSDTDSVGSIGVVTSHVDTSNAEHQRGVKVTDITAGKYKRIASQHEPLTQEGRASIQDELDQIYGVFVDAVARNRGTDADTVATRMADGRVFRGQKAIDAGLADGKVTLPQLIQQMKSQKGGGSTAPVSRNNPKKGQQGMDATGEVVTFTSAQVEAAKQEGFKAGLTQGRTEGATGERERIKAVETATLAGHEALIAALKFDGKTTGPEAAAQVVAAENVLRAGKLTALRAEAPAPVPESTADAKAEQERAEAKAKAKPDDPKAVATKARVIVAEEQKAGRKITYAEAVKRVTEAK
jgi:signal peptide peptidase SppA